MTQAQVGANEEFATLPLEDEFTAEPETARSMEKATLRLSREAWNLVFRRTARGFVSHQLPDMAATLTYYAVLSLAPSVVAVMSLAALFGQGRRTANAFLSSINNVAPGSAITLLRKPLRQFIDSPNVGIALVVAVALAIWATSSYIGGFGRGMNRIYQVNEGRPLWRLKPFQILLSVIILLLGFVTISAIVLTGPVAANVGDSFDIGATGNIIWTIVKWPALVVAVILVVTILYYATPNARHTKLRWMSAGALLSVIVLIGVSLLFSLYIRDFAHFDRTYRSFAGVIMLLLWLWIANLTLLFGAEFDAQFERARQLEAGIAAERHIQLPPRDTEISIKNAKKEASYIEDGIRIREAADRRRMLGN
ncbi:YihY/virulence factor BrkB family protein [soil metagenome]